MAKSAEAHVVHVTSAHPANDVRIYQREARSLAKMGFNVRLLAPCNDLPAVDGSVKIIALPKGSGRLRRMLMASPRMVRRLWKQQADIIHLHDPELIPGGVFLRLMRRKVIYDAHEDLPDQILAKTYIPGVVRKPLSLMVRLGLNLIFPLFSGIVAATEPIAERCRNKRVVLVRNYPDIDGDLAALQDSGQGKRSDVLYLGGLATSRGLFDMLDAADEVHKSSDEKIHLVGWFDGEASRLRAEAHPGWEHVAMQGRKDRNGVVIALQNALVGLLPLHPTPAYRNALPVKLFEYMAAGLAVVAPQGHQWGNIITDIGCGVLYDRDQAGALADAIVEMQQNPDDAIAKGERGREAIINRYNWRSEAKALRGLYESILDR